MKRFLHILFFILISTIIFSKIIFAESDLILNVNLVPKLDISIFSKYNLTADILGSPSAVSVEIFGTTSGTEVDWNFYVDGTPDSVRITKNMYFDSGSYVSQNIYPDDIYPEIFFAPSSVTWYNLPNNIWIRRNSYHLFHFENPFTMFPNSSFFIEVNATPSSTVNSADLNIYLVGKDQSIDFFTGSDWRSKIGVGLVGSLGKEAVYHHTHREMYSSHHLISLMTDANGKIAVDPSNPIDINGDFWIVLYSNSPNTNRGWGLKYHQSGICDNENRWYIGNQTGWSTTTQSGCPDVHIHMARRGENPDGIGTIITTLYSNSEPQVEETYFSFEPLPNLAPNPTSFITPLAGGTYDGGTGPTEEIYISWNEATDSNNDELTYKIYYSDDGSTYILIDTTDNLNLAWDVSLVDNGSYILKGEVCEKSTADLFCTEFYLPDTFSIQKNNPIYTLTGDIKIFSNNSNTSLAKTGDTVTLIFSSTGDISSTRNVSFYSGGSEITNSVSYSYDENDWTATYVVSENDIDGIIDFEINAENLDLIYSDTTDDSFVTVDVTPPEDPSPNPSSGTYDSDQHVTLSSEGSYLIKYTIDDSQPTCSTGTTYTQEITVQSPTTIKAIACDEVGNYSSISSFTYNFSYTLNYLSGSGGSISGDSIQNVSYGENGSQIIAVPNDGYYFSKWSDNLLTASRTDTNIAENLEVTAFFEETEVVVDLEEDEKESSECSKSKPRGIPEIYKIVSEISSLTIFFTSLENLDKYYLDYSTKPSADEYRIKFGPNPADNQEYKIKNLQSNTTYYFRVSGQNGCRSGNWSNIKSAVTLGEQPAFNIFQPNNYFEVTSVSIENSKPNKCSHIVESGDTLWKVSSEVYGNGIFYDLIIKNNLEKYPDIENRLSIGWELTFPCEFINEEENLNGENETNLIDSHNVLIKVQNQGIPIQGAKVELFSDPREGFTNEIGEVLFENVPKGEHTIKVSYNNFTTHQILAVSGEEKDFNVVLNIEMKESKNIVPIIVSVILFIFIIFFYFIFIRKNHILIPKVRRKKVK